MALELYINIKRTIYCLIDITIKEGKLSILTFIKSYNNHV